MINPIEVAYSVDARAGNWSENSFPRAAQVSYSCRSCWSSIAQEVVALFSGRLFCRSELHSAFLLWSCQTVLHPPSSLLEEHLQPTEPPSSVTHYLPFLGLSSSLFFSWLHDRYTEFLALLSSRRRELAVESQLDPTASYEPPAYRPEIHHV